MLTTPNLKEALNIIQRYLPPDYQVVLFGSRATGRARPNSDWDIGLLGPAPLHGATLEYIAEALEELPTLHSFDVVDFNQVSEAFRQSALQQALPLT